MENSYLGKGWKFPVEVDVSTGRIKTVSREEDIREAIKIILLTEYRERLMRFEFGSNMKEYMFSNSSRSTYSSMEIDAQASIQIWEPRVKNVEVKVYPDERDNSIVYLEVSCTVKSTEVSLNQTVALNLK